MPSLDPFRNAPEFPWELQAGAGELNDPVYLPWHGLAVRFTRRPGQRCQHHAPTGSFLGRLDKEFLERDIDVNIVEFEVEGGPHMGRAYDARCGVVLPSHPPQFLAFGERHLDPAVAAENGAFDRDFSGHFPNFTTTARGRESGLRAGCSASTFILVAAWEQSLHPGSPGHRLAHRKGPLNAENAVRTTGLLTAGRNPGTERTRLPAVDEQGEQRYFRGTTTSRPLDCGLSPLHHGSIHSLNSAPHQTTSARSAKSSSPACKRLVAGHWPRGGGGGPSPAATSFSSPFRPAQTTSSCFEWTPTLS